MKFASGFATAALVAFAGASAHAQNFNVWDSTVIGPQLSGNSAQNGTDTSGVDLGLGPTLGADDLQETLAYDPNTPILSDPAHADVYGGFDSAIDTTNGTGFGGTMAIILRNEGFIRFQNVPPGSADGYLNGFVSISAPAGAVDFDQQTITLASTDANLNYTPHLLIQSGSDIYVSENSYVGTMIDSLFNVSASSTNWVLWDFENDGFEVDFAGAAAAPVGLSVDGVGVYVTGNNFGDNSVDVQYTLSGLGVAIPEPASIALLGLGAAMVGFRRRRTA